MGLVASTHKILIEHGGTAVVTGASHRVRRAFEETNLSRFIPLLSTDEDAQDFLTKIS